MRFVGILCVLLAFSVFSNAYAAEDTPSIFTETNCWGTTIPVNKPGPLIPIIPPGGGGPSAPPGVGPSCPTLACNDLGWLSGGYQTHLTDFMALRPNNSPTQICSVFSTTGNDWANITRVTDGTIQDALRAKCCNLIVALRVFPMNTNGSNCDQWRRAASGEYDNYYRQMAARMKAGIPPNAVIRVGWELNSDYPWGIMNCRTDQEIEWYKSGHRRIVDILRSDYSNQMKVSWNFLKNTGKLSRPLIDYYPGGDYIDYISIDYYDNQVDSTTVTAFDAFGRRGSTAKPFGIYTWLDFANSVGKLIAFDEWGLVPPDRGGKGDNPGYIEGMFRFFEKNKSKVAYEAYFNGGSRGHKLSNLPGAEHPRASAMYQSLYGPSNAFTCR